jgi:hypothetical protein
MLQLRCNNKEEMNLDSSAAKGTRMPSRAPFFTDVYRARFFGHNFDLSGVLDVGFLPGETRLARAV